MIKPATFAKQRTVYRIARLKLFEHLRLRQLSVISEGLARFLPESGSEEVSEP